MAETPETFYVTTPIYYVNARPHIGHAYTTIVADVLARRRRLLGEDVWFLTGTDEHGQKIERSARAAGIAPQLFTDQVSAEFRQLWDRMGLTYDQYIRTTDRAHKRGVQKLFRELQDRGQIYLSSYTGQYCVSEEIFVEGPPGTIGPDGRLTETVIEENYFFRLSDYQLKLINLIESNELEVQPEARKNELLSFLRGPVHEPGVQLSRSAAGNAYIAGALRDLSISRSSFTWGIPVPGDERHVIYVWLDALANYITAIGYGDDSPEARATFEKYWPADIHLVGKEIIRQHCIYWPAFLLAAGLPLPKKIVAHGWLLFEESKMSKSRGNIVRTETILDAFGALCPPAPRDLPPQTDPQTQPLSSRSEAERSASLPEASTPPDLSSFANGGLYAVPLTPAPPSKHEQDLFAADVLRYFLLREIPFGQDGSFSFDAMITRYNADLANGYGNLVSRTLNMLGSYSSAFMPPLPLKEEGEQLSAYFDSTYSGFFVPLETWRFQAAERFTSVMECFDEGKYGRALVELWEIVTWLDKGLSRIAPWKPPVALSSEDVPKLRAQVLTFVAEHLRIITALLYPILPYATANVWRQLGLGDIELAARNGELTNLQWGGLKPGTRLGPLSPIFPRADKGLAQIMADMELSKSSSSPIPSADRKEASGSEAVAPTDPAASPRTATLTESSPGAQVGGSRAETTERPGTPSHAEAPASGIFAGAQPADASPQITIDDFTKVEMRVAKVLVCERIPKADKLLRLEVDLGFEKRQILSGLAAWYTPEDLIGRRIVVITNLAPRTMRGLESHGMLLAASAPEGGKPALATFADNDTLPLGSRLK